MAGLRPGRCYHKLDKKPYTRIAIRVPKKSYAKGVPVSKIHQFEIGKNGDYPVQYHLVSGKATAMRSNCLEAARVMATKHLEGNLGADGFFLKIRVIPLHVLRENAMATGAGADRFSSGMRMSFGRPIGQAARVTKGQKIMTAYVPAGKEAIAKEAIRRARSKLPGQCRVVAG